MHYPGTYSGGRGILLCSLLSETGVSHSHLWYIHNLMQAHIAT